MTDLSGKRGPNLAVKAPPAIAGQSQIYNETSDPAESSIPKDEANKAEQSEDAHDHHHLHEAFALCLQHADGTDYGNNGENDLSNAKNDTQGAHSGDGTGFRSAATRSAGGAQCTHHSR